MSRRSRLIAINDSALYVARRSELKQTEPVEHNEPTENDVPFGVSTAFVVLA